jgi:hypothetical protein
MTRSALQSRAATSSERCVDRLTSSADRLRKCLGLRPISVDDVGRARIRYSGLSRSQTVRAPTQPLGNLLQRLDLHIAMTLRHEAPLPDSTESRFAAWD